MNRPFEPGGVLLSLLIGVVLVCPSIAKADVQRPNILMILVDDLGYGDLSYMGATDLRSPHVDAIAKAGIRFQNFYANCPVCSPTRAALLTGRYPDMVGVPGVIRTHPENNWGHLTKEAVLLPSVLKTAGYKTAMFGKWHLGLESPNIPNDRGFDHFEGYLGDMMDDYYKHRRHGINYMRSNRKEIDPQGHATDLFTDWCVNYIKQQSKSDPYFIYLAYNAPHTPIQPPPEWVAKVKRREEDISDRRAKLVALIEHMDGGIGQVMQAVKDSYKRTNRPTLVIFSSDNGGQVNVGANNGNLRDGKQSVYEGGLKVPTCAMFVGATRINPGDSQFQALTMDLFPTICDFAGAKFDHEIDGKSIRPIIEGQKQTELRALSFFRRREGGLRYQGKTIEAVRQGPWKLLQNSPFEPLEMYYLPNDPKEEHDLSRDPKHRRKFNELAAALRKEIQRYGRIPWQKQK